MSDASNLQNNESRHKLFEQFLKCIDREETLIHYRLMWGMQWNIATFAALIAIQQITIPEWYKFAVILILSLFGIMATTLSFIGIIAAHRQTEYLIKEINARLGVKDDDWSETEFIRPYGDPNTAHKRARYVSRYIPLLFAVIWILVLLWSYPSLFNQMR